MEEFSTLRLRQTTMNLIRNKKPLKLWLTSETFLFKLHGNLTLSQNCWTLKSASKTNQRTSVRKWCKRPKQQKVRLDQSEPWLFLVKFTRDEADKISADGLQVRVRPVSTLLKCPWAKLYFCQPLSLCCCSAADLAICRRGSKMSLKGSIL